MIRSFHLEQLTKSQIPIFALTEKLFLLVLSLQLFVVIYDRIHGMVLVNMMKNGKMTITWTCVRGRAIFLKFKGSA